MSNFAHRRRSEIVKKCISTSQKVASDNGFVCVHKLAEELDAEVIFSPILVEAVIAKKSDLNNEGPLWKIVVNEEDLGDEPDMFKKETYENPLSVRLRNTIAHELVHTFQFNVRDDKLVLGKVSDSVSRSDAVLRRIEREAHRLTSFLLLPRFHFHRMIRQLPKYCGVDDLVRIREHFAVSRYIFVQALQNLRMVDDENILYADSLKDVMVGVGFFGDDGVPRFQQWPTFRNFMDNSSPDFVFKNDNAKFFLIPGISEGSMMDSKFENGAKIRTYEGSKVVPRYRKVDYILTTEAVSVSPGSRFLFMLTRIGEVKEAVESLEPDVSEKMNFF